MDQAHLRDLLGQLHAELARGDDTLDERNRALLQAVHEDVERLATQPATADSAQVRGRLQDAVVSFQTSHPQLATNLESTMNALSNLGL